MEELSLSRELYGAMASLPVRPALRRRDRSWNMRVRLSQASLAMFHLRAPDGKNPHLLFSAKLDEASALPVKVM